MNFSNVWKTVRFFIATDASRAGSGAPSSREKRARISPMSAGRSMPPEQTALQEPQPLQFWQSVGLDGLWNVIRGTGEAVCDFRPEKLDKLVEGMGYLGTALSILDVAAADIKGDNVGVASGTLSTIMNFATGQMASAIGTPVMTVSMAGISVL